MGDPGLSIAFVCNYCHFQFFGWIFVSTLCSVLGSLLILCWQLRMEGICNAMRSL